MPKNNPKKVTFSNIFQNLKTGDRISVITKKTLTDLKITSITSYGAVGQLNGNQYIIHKNSLDKEEFSYNAYNNNQIGVRGKLKDVVRIIIHRGYDEIYNIKTAQPSHTPEKFDQLEDIYTEIKKELNTITKGSSIELETAFLSGDDDELIDNDTLSKLIIDIISVDSSNHVKCIVQSITGPDESRYSDLIGVEAFFNKTKLLFIRKINNSKISGIYLRMLIRDQGDKIINIVNIIDLNISKTKAKDQPEEEDDSLSDQEIFNIMAKDPTMKKMLTKSPSLMDFIMKRNDKASSEEMFNVLRKVRSNIKNKQSYSTVGKTFKLTYLGPDVIDKKSKSELKENSDYLGSILDSNNNGVYISITPKGYVSKSSSSFIMHIKDDFKENGINRGDLYFGVKKDIKSIFLIEDNVEINVKG